MRKLLLAGVAAILSATGAYAAPVTPTTTLTSGGYTFSNFSCSPGGSQNGFSGSCGAVDVELNGTSGIVFNGSLLAFSQAGASTSSFLDVVLAYQVTSTTPISTINLDFNGAVTGSFARSEVVETAFTALGGTQLGQTQVDTPSSRSATLTLSQPQTSVYLKKDVSVTALTTSSADATASISFIDQTFPSTGGGSPGTPTPVPTPTPTPTPTPSAVPEPVSLALLGSGLVGLGLIRRTKRS